MSFPSLLFVKHHSSVGKTWWCIPDNSPIKRYNIVSREFFPLDERLSILGFPLSAWCRGIAALCWSSGSVVRSVYRPLVSSVHEHPSYCGNDCSYEPEEPSLGEIFAKSCKKRRRRDGKSNSHWTAFKLIFFSVRSTVKSSCQLEWWQEQKVWIKTRFRTLPCFPCQFGVLVNFSTGITR